MSERRYFIGGDQSGHQYAVPVELREEWFAWLNLDEDNEVPTGALRIDGDFTFTDPQFG